MFVSEPLKNAMQISLDIKNIYTNIPADEGIKAMKIQLEKRQDKSIPTDFILNLIKIILECNIFEFDKKYYLQLIGIAMGTRMAPTFANIFWET